MTDHKQGVEQLQQVREAEADTLTLDEKYELAYGQAAYEETGLNGDTIDWRYWVHQMPILIAFQAACLMSALEPDLFASLNERPGKNDPTENIRKARKIQNLAEAEGKLTASPAEWVEWAKVLSINVHTGFLLAVQELPEVTAADVDTPAAAKVEAETEIQTEKLEPWLIVDPRDPTPEQPWYTPARYFARQLVIDDSTLLTKRAVLADKVVQSLTNAGINKRGNKKSFDRGTILKAFTNVPLG